MQVIFTLVLSSLGGIFFAQENSALQPVLRQRGIGADSFLVSAKVRLAVNDLLDYSEISWWP